MKMKHIYLPSFVLLLFFLSFCPTQVYAQLVDETTDTDGDGIVDVDDYDDDNDGIIDCDECPAKNAVRSPNMADRGAYTYTGGWRAINGVTVTDGRNGSVSQTVPHLTKYCEDQLTVRVRIRGNRPDGRTSANMDLRVGGTTYARFSIPRNNTASARRDGTARAQNGATVQGGNFNVLRTSASDQNRDIRRFIYYTVSIPYSGLDTAVVGFYGSGNAGFVMTDLLITAQFDCVDTDGDGVPDIRDKNSDNDNCPDAIESGFEGYSVEESYLDSTVVTLADSVFNPTMVNANGIPVAVANANGFGVNYTHGDNAIIAGGCVELCCNGRTDDFDLLIDTDDVEDCPIEDIDQDGVF